MNQSTGAILLGDVGGTNTRLAFAGDGGIDGASVRRLPNDDFPDLPAALRHYLAGQPAPVRVAVAVAGPVHGGTGRLTNRDWRIAPEEIAEATGAAQVAVINDLEAQAWALDALAADALVPVLAGGDALDGPRLVIGVGTGFNTALRHGHGAHSFVAAAEAGHAALPVATAADLALADFVTGEDGFASVEDVLSGRGVEAVFRFVTGRDARAGEVMRRLAEGGAEAEAAARLVVRHLAMVAGDLALCHLPFGGIHLCGGVARALAPHLGRLGFAGTFRAKGRMSGFMDHFHLSVITDDYAALTGCLTVATTAAATRG